jgi:DNA mismatch repair ATPase MutS
MEIPIQPISQMNPLQSILTGANLTSIFNNLNKKETEKKPEEKDEKDLTSSDRMHLISKQIEDSFLISAFLEIIKIDSILLDFPSVSMNTYVFEDVELFSDHHQNESLSVFSKINHTKTVMGENALKKILNKPLYDIQTLKQRQFIINKVSNLRNQILPKLKEIKSIENDLVWFWNTQNMNHINMMNDYIYFNFDFIPFFNLNQVLNTNERALLATNIYKIVVAPFLTIITPIVSLLVPLVFFIIATKKMNPNIKFGQMIQLYLKTIHNLNPLDMFFGKSRSTALAGFLTKAFYIFMYFQNVYYSIQSARSSHNMINIIHEKLNKMSKYIKLSKDIQNICKLNQVHHLDTFLRDDKVESDIEKSIVQFNYPTFDSEPGIFTHKGIILKVFQQFRLSKNSLHSCFQYIAYIDAILSISTLLNNSSSSHPYCYSKYIENAKNPNIHMKEIWHPYLNESVNKNVVKNDLIMDKNILITGPNAAGKSTLIKNLILNIIFSQTMCVSTGTHFELTPFYMLETYLQIPDSKGSESLFEAEMYRSRDYLEKLKSLDEKQFSFIVLDEIFSSTNYVEGFSGAYAILKKISTFTNTLSITTTHYSDLECLEKDTKDRFMNYKFEVDIDTNNNIHFNYLLKRGTSRQYIALQLLKQNGFEDDIIESAIEMSKHISVNKTSKTKKNKKLKTKKIKNKNKNEN